MITFESLSLIFHGLVLSGSLKQSLAMLSILGWWSRIESRLGIDWFDGGSKLMTDAYSATQHKESRDHIFFGCNYGYDLWRMLTDSLQLPPQQEWRASVNQMLTLPPPETQRNLTLLAWQSTLYWLWNERNARLHANNFRSYDQLFKVMDARLKNKIQSFRETNPSRCSTMMQSWIRFSWHRSSVTTAPPLPVSSWKTKASA